MNETTIIKGEKGKIKILAFIGLGVIGFALLLHLLNIGSCRSWVTYSSYSYTKSWNSSALFVEHLGFEGHGVWTIIIGILTYLGIIISILGVIFLLAYRNVSITVTDKRVFGTAAWGKRVDLPLDKISAVSTSFLHGIAVASSSGSISFKAITNNVQVHSEISKLLIERQEKPAAAPAEPAPAAPAALSNAEELKKFKDLLDSGVITQEEFDAKKKKLLGL